MNMHVSQVFLSDQGGTDLPPPLQAATATVRAAFPQARYRIYDEAALQDLLRTHFPREVREAYDRLVPYSYKADLARYCLLHAFGGWYFDIGVRMAGKREVPQGVELIAFRDVQRNSGTNWACAAGVVYSVPGNPVMQRAIERVLRNVATDYYGITPLCPTGPTVFGHALAEAGANPHFLLGDLMPLTPSHPKRNLAYVLPDGDIVAFRKAAGGGDLTALGATGVNNYNEFWQQRCIYRPAAV